MSTGIKENERKFNTGLKWCSEKNELSAYIIFTGCFKA